MVSPVTTLIVVVGVGIIGPRHATHVAADARSRLFGIVDPSAAGPAVAAQFGVPHFESIAHMVAECDAARQPYPQGAIVCTPTATHVAVAAQLALHGIHLLVEKPLLPSPAAAMALKRHADAHAVKLLVGHHRRFNPHIVAAKCHLHRVGRVVAVQGTWALHKPAQYFALATWRTSRALGGGALLINLVHDIDLLRYMFGPIWRVYAEPTAKQKEFDADEGAVLTIRFASGVCGTFVCLDAVTSPFNFESATGENPTIPHHADVQGVYQVFGNRGTLSIPDLTLYHQDSLGEPSWLEPVACQALDAELHTKPFDRQLLHFIDVIRGCEPLCTALDGMAALLCLDAVAQSIATGLPQVVADVEAVEPDYKALGLEYRIKH